MFTRFYFFGAALGPFWLDPTNHVHVTTYHQVCVCEQTDFSTLKKKVKRSRQ